MGVILCRGEQRGVGVSALIEQGVLDSPSRPTPLHLTLPARLAPVWMPGSPQMIGDRASECLFRRESKDPIPDLGVALTRPSPANCARPDSNQFWEDSE